MEEKTATILGTLRQYGETTSAHGIPRAVTTKSVPRRLFWTCLFLASFSYFCCQAYDLVNKYIDYPVTTDIKIQWSELEFPAVTICNANPLRFSKLLRLGHEGFQNAGFIPKPAKTSQGNQGKAQGRPLQQAKTTTVPSPTTTVTTEATTPDYDSEDDDDYDYDYDDHHEDFKTANTFMGLIANLNSSTRQAIGHQARDFIQECQFDGRACSPKNFSIFTDSTYGNCFTFNKASGNTAPQSATSAGPLNGLSLILYIEQEEYIPSLTEKAGVRVVVHSPARWPFPEFEGFDAAPGFLTSAGLRLTSITRLGGRYGDCTNGGGYELLYPGTYTQTNCLVTCHQGHMVSVCGCADPSLRAPVNTTFCDSTTTSVDCKNRVRREIVTGVLACTCPASCSDKVYGKAIGLSEWPADSYLTNVLTKLQTKKGRRPGTAILGDTDRFKRNLLKLNIYYEALNYEKISESPGYEEESLLGDLGGQLGLWVGMSLLSAMEILEIFADLFAILCKKISSKEMKSSKKIDVAPSETKNAYDNLALTIKGKM
ncbi:amiloride-sensitive sodium channel subunit alpha-like [Branchiostoma lanceolatum]|uniref:amiloride-sensitive sodium channel subunit alpha-like n=1 Tax=Branchiostoma lanceolatum TaxID=7740 RepID=UPI00345653D0